MRDTQILSAFQELEPAPAASDPSRAMVFDACHVGVVLRAVLFVEAVVAVVTMFGAISFLDWLTRLSLLTGAALPATLVWLIATCSLKKVLARRGQNVQYIVGAVLGAVAGLYGCAVLAMVGLIGPTPWLASAFSGAGLAMLMVAALVLRAKAKTPAAVVLLLYFYANARTFTWLVMQGYCAVNRSSPFLNTDKTCNLFFEFSVKSIFTVHDTKLNAVAGISKMNCYIACLRII